MLAGSWQGSPAACHLPLAPQLADFAPSLLSNAHPTPAVPPSSSASRLRFGPAGDTRVTWQQPGDGGSQVEARLRLLAAPVDAARGLVASALQLSRGGSGRRGAVAAAAAAAQGLQDSEEQRL